MNGGEVVRPTGDTRGDLLVGAYDTHIHAGPDIVPRSVDFLQTAREAAAAGMAGVVFKDVSQPTSDRAFAVNQSVPGLRAFGGIVLDHPVGGLNPLAVERCLKHGGRFVWMPVSHARHTVALYEQGRLRMVNPPGLTREDAISLLDDEGELRPVVREIVRLIAVHDAVLGTGHISPEEAIALVRQARAAGVRRILVNHPSGYAVGASIAQQQELADLGAFMEHCYAQCTPGIDGLPVATIAEAIRAVGAARSILATDLGQTFNPSPVAGLRRFLDDLRGEGIADTDLRLMVADNPGRLLEHLDV